MGGIYEVLNEMGSNGMMYIPRIYEVLNEMGSSGLIYIPRIYEVPQ
jgi:sugar-specific transcriptional regulator TrmB